MLVSNSFSDSSFMSGSTVSHPRVTSATVRSGLSRPQWVRGYRPLADPDLAGVKIGVTGAGGFIGGRLVERLTLEHDALVQATVRSWHSAVWISRYNAAIHSANVQDTASLTTAFKGCDVVVHCANGGNRPEEIWATNVGGTKNVIQACLDTKVRRLVFVSSIAVHGCQPPNGVDELSPYDFEGSVYSRSKIAAERLVKAVHRSGDLETVIIRPTFVWGPRSALFSVRPLQAMQQGRFRLVNQGSGDCHAVFVETVVDALIRASAVQAAAGRAFLVADDFGIQWRDFYTAYAQMLNLDPDQLPSVDAKRLTTRGQAFLYGLLKRKLEDWKGNPAPLWRKVLRRSSRIVADKLAAGGAMNLWDLRKQARQGSLNTDAMQRVLKVRSRYSFNDAMELTEQWLRDQACLPLDGSNPR
ncbi:MAG: hypothetical protein CBB71_22910 [Rhodopirellula sp. TMED11]|nr:MAG: hypothetical protein CBB71_22910 [Rhodopirellula sp. TMED11]